MGVLCAARQVGRTWSSHPESALRSPFHAPLPRARGGNTGGARAFGSPRGHVKSAAGHPEPALSRPGDELDLATATVSGSAVLQQLTLSPAQLCSPRVSPRVPGPIFPSTPRRDPNAPGAPHRRESAPSLRLSSHCTRSSHLPGCPSKTALPVGSRLTRGTQSESSSGGLQPMTTSPGQAWVTTSM